jgi:hypothetical protein
MQTKAQFVDFSLHFFYCLDYFLDRIQQKNRIRDDEKGEILQLENQFFYYMGWSDSIFNNYYENNDDKVVNCRGFTDCF